MQKKILGFSATLVVLLLLLALYFTVLQPRWSQIPKMDAFEISENCPYLCWKGISPGKTTYTEARQILQTSWDVDQRSFRSRNKDMYVGWFTERTQMRSAGVRILSENDVVQSITFSPVGPFRLDNFISLLGEPDFIRILHEETTHGTDLISYGVHFQKYCLSIWVMKGRVQGPHPQDFINSIRLRNEILCSPGFDEIELVQPWLGYGRLNEYLPGYDFP